MNQADQHNSETVHAVKETDSFNKTHDQEGRAVVNQYTFVKKLGEGAFGKVKLAVQVNSQEKFAVKVIKKELLKRKREMVRDDKGRMRYKDAFEDVLREIAIMKKVNHPNLIKLSEVINNPEASKLYMIMEYAERGQIIEFDEDDRIFFSLEDKPVIDEEELRSIFAQIINGIHYLHVNGIVHRDIKPQNILQAADGTIKIADFGVSNILGDSDVLTKVEGTHHFMSPESLMQEDTNGYSGKIADIWAMGVSFFAFTYYKPPFDGEDLCELFENIKFQDLVFPEGRTISDELKDLLTQILNKDPTKRITLEELKTHPWFLSSENKEALISNLQAKPEEITVTNEEISNAISSFEKVIFLKKVVKKMVTNFRKFSTLKSEASLKLLRMEQNSSLSDSDFSKSEGTLAEVVTKEPSINSLVKEALELQPAQKQSSAATE